LYQRIFIRQALSERKPSYVNKSAPPAGTTASDGRPTRSLRRCATRCSRAGRPPSGLSMTLKRKSRDIYQGTFTDGNVSSRPLRTLASDGLPRQDAGQLLAPCAGRSNWWRARSDCSPGRFLLVCRASADTLRISAPRAASARGFVRPFTAVLGWRVAWPATRDGGGSSARLP
jgi:hypothetical protein